MNRGSETELRPTAPEPEPCVASEQTFLLAEPGGPRRFFSVHGYLARVLRVTREGGEGTRSHCITVAWPNGRSNNDGSACSAADSIDESWFRSIQNTLARVPFHHVRTLHRLVIDNRPREHGIAAFDRRSPDDARDGHTIWLHEHLFMSPNHWARGNHGLYWSYHVNEDGKVIDGLPNDHDSFSPVLLHELGHIVMYNLINPRERATETPDCARTCADTRTCERIPASEREAGCISPYCKPFKFQAGTENWAEQYRFHYQSAITRSLLGQSRAACAPLLERQDLVHEKSHGAPWERGLPDVPEFRRSLWNSCGGRACKAW
jgi:hypothetical protein